MKKIMTIGAVDSGKTTLLLVLRGEAGEASKTQALQYNSFTIDTPGEYMENPMMYKALMSTALEAKYILFIQDSTVNKSIFPPGFARAFPCKTIGVITKVDHLSANIENAKKILERLRLKGPVFAVSSFTEEGIDELKQYIELNALQK